MALFSSFKETTGQTINILTVFARKAGGIITNTPDLLTPKK